VRAAIGRGAMVQQDVLQVVEGGPLGDLEAGTVASLVSAEFSIVSGGLACIAGRPC
jgi:hypothetical protein